MSNSWFLVLCLAFVAETDAVRGKGRTSGRISGRQATNGSSTSSSLLEGGEAYDAWRRIYRPDASNDSVSYATRLTLFNRKVAQVASHNAKPGMTWRETLNHFADWTPEEFQAMLGYRRHADWYKDRASEIAAMQSSSSLLEEKPSEKPDLNALAKTVDWRIGYDTSNRVKNQKECGSCWAAASAGCLDWYAEKYVKEHNLAIQGLTTSMDQLVDCTENENHCGGDGGCKGATGELAFSFATKFGVASARFYSGKGDSQGDTDIPTHCTSHQGVHGVSVGNYYRLPVNKVSPLMTAVATVGPVVISADATMWSQYEGGIFSGCPRDVIVNHAVILVGYGEEDVDGTLTKYWVIRNSWGSNWGESGYMRLLRHDGDIDSWDAGYCGYDADNQQGVGCKNDPKVIPVCGHCGCLSDSVYPIDVIVLDKEPPQEEDIGPAVEVGYEGATTTKSITNVIKSISTRISQVSSSVAGALGAR